jgi:hypothetical protein
VEKFMKLKIGKDSNQVGGVEMKVDPKHPPYISVTEGMSGHFAVCLWWNPDGFWEPWDTYPARRATKDEAIADAKEWAQVEGLEFRHG